VRTARPLTEKSRDSYRKSAPNLFMAERLDRGAVVVNEKTGYGHAIFPFLAKSNEAESGKQVAFVIVDCYKTPEGEVIRMPKYIPGAGGKRVPHFNQEIIEWDIVVAIAQALLKLVGQPYVQEQKAETIRMDKAAVVDKQAGEMAELMARFGNKL